MSRVKGSKNKKKVEAVETILKKADEPKTPNKFTCLCSHKEELHYGGEKGYCNAAGCGCLEYRK